jgi:hypothetical protein
VNFERFSDATKTFWWMEIGRRLMVHPVQQSDIRQWLIWRSTGEVHDYGTCVAEIRVPVFPI